jgi:hypothetical protein
MNVSKNETTTTTTTTKKAYDEEEEKDVFVMFANECHFS